MSLKRHDAIKNKANDRVGRVDLISQGNILIAYMNDGNRVCPPWEWLPETQVEPVDDNLVAQYYLTIAEMPYNPAK